MGLLEDGETFLNATFDATESVEVTYSVSPHDAGSSVTLNATAGTPASELEPGTFTANQSDNRDFIIQAADIVIDSNRVIPDAGHRITQVNGGVTYVYEVMDIFGDGPWRWHGVGYTTYRIHTTLISQS